MYWGYAEFCGEVVFACWSGVVFYVYFCGYPCAACGAGAGAAAWATAWFQGPGFLVSRCHVVVC